MWRGPSEYITYELFPTSPAVSCMSGSKRKIELTNTGLDELEENVKPELNFELEIIRTEIWSVKTQIDRLHYDKKEILINSMFKN